MIMEARRQLQVSPIDYAPPSYAFSSHAMTRQDISRKRTIVCVHIIGRYPNGLHTVETVVGLSPSSAIMAAIVLVRSAIAALLKL